MRAAAKRLDKFGRGVGAAVRSVNVGEPQERDDCRGWDKNLPRGHKVAPGEEQDADEPNEERIGGEVLVGNLPGAKLVLVGFARASQSWPWAQKAVPDERLALLVRLTYRALWNCGGGMASFLRAVLGRKWFVLVSAEKARRMEKQVRARSGRILHRAGGDGMGHGVR